MATKEVKKEHNNVPNDEKKTISVSFVLLGVTPPQVAPLVWLPKALVEALVAVKSPKSCEFPNVGIVKKSILLSMVGVDPPIYNPRLPVPVLDPDPPPRFGIVFCICSKSFRIFS